MVGLAVLWASLTGAYLAVFFFDPLLMAISVLFVALVALPVAFTGLRAFRIAGGVVVVLLALASLLTLLIGGPLFLPAAVPLSLALLPLRSPMPAIALSSISVLITLVGSVTLADMMRVPSCFEVTMPAGSNPGSTLLEWSGAGIGFGAEQVSTLGLNAGFIIWVHYPDDLTAAGQDTLGQHLRVVFPEATKIRHCQPKLSLTAR